MAQWYGPVMAFMLREVFSEAFLLKFGEMPEDVKQRIAHSHPLQLREWIPFLAVANKAENVFVSSLERAFMPVIVRVIADLDDPDLSKAGSVREMIEAVKEVTEKAGNHPGSEQ